MKTVERFQKGALVPEWLLASNPRSADSKQVTISFSRDCRVYDYEGCFLLLAEDPEEIGQHMITFRDGSDCYVEATTKRILIPGVIMSVSPEKLNAEG